MLEPVTRERETVDDEDAMRVAVRFLVAVSDNSGIVCDGVGECDISNVAPSDAVVTVAENEDENVKLRVLEKFAKETVKLPRDRESVAEHVALCRALADRPERLCETERPGFDDETDSEPVELRESVFMDSDSDSERVALLETAPDAVREDEEDALTEAVPLRGTCVGLRVAEPTERVDEAVVLSVDEGVTSTVVVKFSESVAVELGVTAL